MMESDGNPMHPTFRLNSTPRCTAKAKRTGTRCNAPAVKGCAVCRMHGASGGAPQGPRNGMWRHGGRSNEVADMRRMGAELAREAREVANLIHRGVPPAPSAIDSQNPAKSGGIRKVQGEFVGEALLCLQ